MPKYEILCEHQLADHAEIKFVEAPTPTATEEYLRACGYEIYQVTEIAEEEADETNL